MAETAPGAGAGPPPGPAAPTGKGPAAEGGAGRAAPPAPAPAPAAGGGLLQSSVARAVAVVLGAVLVGGIGFVYTDVASSGEHLSKHRKTVMLGRADAEGSAPKHVNGMAPGKVAGWLGRTAEEVSWADHSAAAAAAARQPPPAGEGSPAAVEREEGGAAAAEEADPRCGPGLARRYCAGGREPMPGLEDAEAGGAPPPAGADEYPELGNAGPAGAGGADGAGAFALGPVEGHQPKRGKRRGPEPVVVETKGGGPSAASLERDPVLTDWLGESVGDGPFEGVGHSENQYYSCQAMEFETLKGSCLNPHITKFAERQAKKFHKATLPVPEHCFTAVNGQRTQPTQVKVGPMRKGSWQIYAKFGKIRPCAILDRVCFNSRIRAKGGVPWIKHAQHAGNIKYFSRDVQKRIKEGSITKDELLAFLPDFKRGSLGTCAVVGSAANVLKAKMGTEIDAHDTVLRFAGPHPAQYKRALGTKATGVFEKRSYSRRFKLISPEKYFFFSGRRSSGPPGENFHKKGKQVVQYGSQIGGWRNEAQGMWKEMTGSRRKAPSGGVARIIALANLSRMGACTRLDLYGFGARQQGQFFNTKKMVNRAHVPALEHRLRSYLMASGVMGKLCVYGD